MEIHKKQKAGIALKPGGWYRDTRYALRRRVSNQLRKVGKGPRIRRVLQVRYRNCGELDKIEPVSVACKPIGRCVPGPIHPNSFRKGV